MHSTPEYRSKPEVKSCQMNGYCILLRLEAECLLNNVKWVMNDSSMFSLIVWNMKCALHKLFAWQCLLFMSSSSIMLGCHAYQTLRRPEQSFGECRLRFGRLLGPSQCLINVMYYYYYYCSYSAVGRATCIALHLFIQFIYSIIHVCSKCINKSTST